MQSQICFMAFLQATVYFKTPTQHPGENNSVKQFLQQKCMERLDPPPVSCFKSARVSPAKSKNLLPSVDIWVLFRLFPQPCSHSPYIGKTAPTKPPWSQGNLFLSSAFCHLRQLVLSPAYLFFAVGCQSCEEGSSIQLHWLQKAWTLLGGRQ